MVLFPVLNWSVFTVNNFVATPGGMGGAEAAFVLMMGTFIPAGMLSLVTFVWRFATFYLAILIGACVITIRGGDLKSTAAESAGDQSEAQASDACCSLSGAGRISKSTA